MTAEILEGGRRIDDKGVIMPWYTSPCLEWLEYLVDLKGMLVFEFGIGDSTSWYESRGAFPYGVDSNVKYSDKYEAMWAEDKETYVTSISRLARRGPRVYDIIIIDGDYRDDCTEHALKHLIPGGHLIIDNYHQPSVEEFWPKTNKLIEGMPIIIYKEPGHYDWKTAVITKP